MLFLILFSVLHDALAFLRPANAVNNKSDVFVSLSIIFFYQQQFIFNIILLLFSYFFLPILFRIFSDCIDFVLRSRYLISILVLPLSICCFLLFFFVDSCSIFDYNRFSWFTFYMLQSLTVTYFICCIALL